MGKKNSIKYRLTLYYATAIVLISVSIFALLTVSIDRQVRVITKDTLLKAVQNSLEDVEYENQVIKIDNDFDSYVKGVTLLVYSERGDLIKGTVPGTFPAYTPLSAGEFQELEAGEHVWMVYDLYHTYDNGQSLWIRGLYAFDDAGAALQAIHRILLFMLPVLLLLVIAAGYRITKQAFEPISAITNAANSINSGTDLSKRLPQGEAQDELYHLTDTLNHMLDRLENSFEVEKEFSSDVSHELKTPLAVTLAECEYALKEEREAGEYIEALQNIQKQTRRTLSMVQQLLQISRTINKKQNIEKEHFSLSILCENLVDELSVMAEEKGVKLQSEIDPDIEVTADETLVMRAIINLINNGMKYRSENQPEPFVRLQVSSHNGWVKIAVSDNGIGIPEYAHDQIFRRFYKVDKARSRQEESFGLGLAMVKWIVDAHDGSITVESKIDEGSAFTITLPC